MDYDWRFSNWDKMSKGISPSSYPKKEIILLYSPKIICSFVQPRLQSIRIMHTQIPTKSIGFICWQLIAGLFLYDLSVILNEGFPHWCKSNNVNLWFHEWKKNYYKSPEAILYNSNILFLQFIYKETRPTIRASCAAIGERSSISCHLELLCEWSLNSLWLDSRHRNNHYYLLAAELALESAEPNAEMFCAPSFIPDAKSNQKC